MNRISIFGLAGVLVLVVAPAVQAEAFYEQQILLAPGWNAVFLEVEPEPVDIEAALAGIPYASIWTWEPRVARATVPVDPAAGLLDRTGWFGRFPRGRPESIFNNLFALRANRAYLIRLDGTLPVTWTVRGKPLLRRQRWQADAFNLTGFHVDPASPPSFGAWFGPSPAHAGQPVYKLDPAGVWRLASSPSTETIQSGVAYWVYTRGVSRYQGPLEIELEASDRLEFGASLTRQTLVLHNRLAGAVTTTLVLRSSARPVPLTYRAIDETTGASSWQPLTSGLGVPVPGGDEALVTLAVRRAGFEDRTEQILELGNGAGARRLIFVGANTTQSSTPTSLIGALAPAAEPSAHALDSSIPEPEGDALRAPRTIGG